MERNEVLEQLQGIFRSVLNEPELQLNFDMSTNDIDNWDSITNMTIISEIESRYGIHFKMRDIIKSKNVGDMCDVIIRNS
ncbi:hypothetical protein HMPREF3034_00703 [Prevotella sp. DNF00663]|uniref:acyl carrier protein n=1 Tax=Prevotella sp. DNF00663 TaxID=1384078 RepID=UPI000782E07A|nr:acyl carrier protein [Prevotella sp. DNF00663]KXB84785.1 hypothetical protein HMPREF3034_00703 [Prevotella sp. DNF00663]